ncbi:hypothetical protein [Ktedonospora formicarum]|uniref:Uncharacterized protein n=1 Tax=Ktedonospora formicarum TaxID=2778364 RepID=A0A8J3I5Y7_9CHLR|nr:hypothetical protein [Ktedonospora formicarum]GHO50942.1 hypothetical protein KSX_91050 [Ktedonospora formicarum]
MQSQEIEAYLAELGQELQGLAVKRPIRILLIGGAFMLTQLRNRVATKDVDVLLKDTVDSPASPSYLTFKAAIRQVANRHQIPPTWLNDLMGEFLHTMGTVPAGRLWRRYGMLEVYIPPRRYILALKLFAGRDKDREDIQALCKDLGVQTRKQAQNLLDEYIPDRRVQELNDVEETLDDFFS